MREAGDLFASVTKFALLRSIKVPESEHCTEQKYQYTTNRLESFSS
jgi:hypothetical protein